MSWKFDVEAAAVSTFLVTIGVCYIGSQVHWAWVIFLWSLLAYSLVVSSTSVYMMLYLDFCFILGWFTLLYLVELMLDFVISSLLLLYYGVAWILTPRCFVHLWLTVCTVWWFLWSFQHIACCYLNSVTAILMFLNNLNLEWLLLLWYSHHVVWLCMCI